MKRLVRMAAGAAVLGTLVFGSPMLRMTASSATGFDDSNIPACADFSSTNPNNSAQVSGGTFTVSTVAGGGVSAAFSFTYYLSDNTCTNVGYVFTAYPAEDEGGGLLVVDYASPLPFSNAAQVGTGTSNSESYAWNNQLPGGAYSPVPFNAICVVAETVGADNSGTPGVLDRAPEPNPSPTGPQCYEVSSLPGAPGSNNFS